MAIEITGMVLRFDGKPYEGGEFVLEANVGMNGWQVVGAAHTEVGGLLVARSEVERLVMKGRPGPTLPALRLVTPEFGEVAVLSAAPMVRLVDDREGVVDFGRLRMLREPVKVPGLHDLTHDGVLVAAVPDELAGDDAGPQPDSAEVARLTKLLASRAQELAQARQEVSATATELVELRQSLGNPAPVVDVIGGIGAQLAATNQVLAAQPIPFRLERATLDLRGTLGASGDTIALDGQGAGGVKAELVIDAPSSARVTQGVPSVVGLTESAAQRVLRSVGFKLDAATQVVGDGGATPGQAIMQHPVAGAQADFGTSVLVVFAVRRQDDD
ncbi:PASTA domain-containing protein [Aestuariimicrobium ganziense]|uniref:PASTA domain-containing protein n=1 Tax=Aestuariimicrobium ganziense TaxID=2773677 RepID=UPI0019408E93|nr:PASTA domain-containing protein [Aestuariimicrobium ganziense]